MRKITIKELHSRLLDIAKVFHQICEKHHIPYYMLGGTMLGAYRHKDIIPWDDDMDFGVPRKYYDSLQTILKEELPDDMFVEDIENSERIKTDTFKIVLKNTRMVDGQSPPPHGIFIDIFPLDYTSLSTSRLSKNRAIYLMVKYGVFAHYEKSPSKMRNAVGAVVKFLNPFSRQSIVELTRMMIRSNAKHHEALANFSGFWGLKEIVDSRVFGVPTLYQMHNTKFYGAENPDAYLKQLYGNYMELPPVEKRHVHCEEVWVETNIK